MEIYLDNSATTKPCPEAISAANTAMTEIYGNPSSLHAMGSRASQLLLESRNALLTSLWGENIASRLPRLPSMKGAEQYGGIIFTASGTESDNLALCGILASCKMTAPEIIVSDSEHPAILQTAEKLKEKGCKVSYLSTKGGKIDLDELKSLLSPKTVLVSVMYVNNETGAIYDLPNIFKTVKSISAGAVCHTDCVQAFKKLPFTPASLGADMITLSAHKVHGLKGVGALWVSRELLAKNKPYAIIHGGGQENSFRSGTENLPGIAAFAAAVKANGGFASSEKFASHAKTLYELLESELPEGVRVNRPIGAFSPHIISLTLPIIKSSHILNHLSSKGIYVSSGSACSSHKNTVSHVLTAFGLPNKEADATIRVSLSEYTTAEEIKTFLSELKNGIRRLVK